MGKKWKVVGDDGKPVEMFKAPKSLFDRLNDDSATLAMLKADMVNGYTVTDNANRAIVDLLYKVKETKNPEAKQYWADRIEAIHRALGMNSSMRDRVIRIEREYSNLYDRYYELLDKCKELEEKLGFYEDVDAPEPEPEIATETKKEESNEDNNDQWGF